MRTSAYGRDQPDGSTTQVPAQRCMADIDLPPAIGALPVQCQQTPFGLMPSRSRRLTAGRPNGRGKCAGSTGGRANVCSTQGGNRPVSLVLLLTPNLPSCARARPGAGKSLEHSTRRPRLCRRFANAHIFCITADKFAEATVTRGSKEKAGNKPGNKTQKLRINRAVYRATGYQVRFPSPAPRGTRPASSLVTSDSTASK